MDRAVRVAILMSFGYLLVVAVVLDAFVQFADASYFVVFQQAAQFPFVCTFPCADFDEPENRSSLKTALKCHEQPNFFFKLNK